MDKKQQYEQSLETVSNIENTKNELLTKFNNISAEDKKDIETVLPNSMNFVRLVSQIDAVAAKYGISINKTSSKAINDPSGNSADGTQSAKLYNSATIGFSFDASYDKFNVFMDDLEKSMRVLDIRSVKLNSQKDKDQDNVYSYDIEFETYWLKSS